MSKHHPSPAIRPADVASENWGLFLHCKVDPAKLGEVNRIVARIRIHRKRYESVVKSFGTMPWWFVAVVHAMESGLSFRHHLHNGDPLTGRTRQVPAFRPKANPKANPNLPPGPRNPYTWEESAEDALTLKGLEKWTDWSLSASLAKLEEYNGWGYRLYHPSVRSPYIWSFTNRYTKGKYAADGKFDANLVSGQAGTAAILRVMVDSGLVTPTDYLGDFPTPSSATAYA